MHHLWPYREENGDKNDGNEEEYETLEEPS